MNRPARTTGQIPDDFLGQSLASLAVAGRIVRHGRQPAIFAIFLEAFQGITTGLIGRKDLRQEHTKSDPRGVDPAPPFVVPSAAGRLDLVGGQDLNKREPRLLIKLVPDSIGLAARRMGNRLDHRDLLVVVDWWGFGLTHHQITARGGHLPIPENARPNLL